MAWETKLVQFPPIPAKFANSEFCEKAYFRAYATAFSLLYGLTTSIFPPKAFYISYAPKKKRTLLGPFYFTVKVSLSACLIIRIINIVKIPRYRGIRDMEIWLAISPKSEGITVDPRYAAAI